MKAVLYPNETVSLLNGDHVLKSRSGVQGIQGNVAAHLTVQDDAADGLIQVLLNGHPVISESDMIYDGAGRAGVWVRGDARIANFRVEPLTKPLHETPLAETKEKHDVIKSEPNGQIVKGSSKTK
eukprot:Selendium_serpulae@DN4897_c0_g1_i1.p2